MNRDPIDVQCGVRGVGVGPEARQLGYLLWDEFTRFDGKSVLARCWWEERLIFKANFDVSDKALLAPMMGAQYF
jgi:hypothetical protein